MRWVEEDKGWWNGYSGEIKLFYILYHPDCGKGYMLSCYLPSMPHGLADFYNLEDAKDKAEEVWEEWLEKAELTSEYNKMARFYVSVSELVKGGAWATTDEELLCLIENEVDKVKV